MHLYVIMRGIKNNVDNLINDLQAQFFPYEVKKGKDKGIYQAQFAVRPIQLYEFVFPEDALPVVQKTLWNNQDGYYPTEDNWKIKKMMQFLRKVLGASKMPPIPKDALPRPLRNFDVAIQPVGIKKDKFNEEQGREIL